MVEKAQAQNLMGPMKPKMEEKINKTKNYANMSTEELKSKIRAMELRHSTIISIAGPPKEELEELKAMKLELAKRTGQPYQPQKIAFDPSSIFKGLGNLPPEAYIQ